IFAVGARTTESSFNIRGDKGLTNDPVAVHFVGEALFIEGADQGPYSAVWGWKTDGTKLGPMVPIGGDKPISTYRGSFSILDKNHIGLAERGCELLHIYAVG